MLGNAEADTDTPYRAGHRYVAVWQMPTIESAVNLEKGLAASGWHELFEQVNERGEMRTLSEVLGDMATLETP